MTEQKSRIILSLKVLALCTVVFILLVNFWISHEKSNFVAAQTRELYHPNLTSYAQLTTRTPPTTSPTENKLTFNSTANISIKVPHSQPDSNNNNGAIDGYVLVADFTEQMESSLYDLYQLTNIATAWRMQVVEPHIKATRFALGDKTNTQALKFSSAFNLEDTNSMLQEQCLKSNYPPIIPFKTFTETLLSIQVTAVVLYFHPYSESSTTCNSRRHSDASHLIQRVNGHLKLRAATADSKLHQIELFKIVCINIREANNFKLLLQTHPTLKALENTAIESHSKILIIIPKWNGIRKTRDSFFYYDPHYTQNNCQVIHCLPHSNQIISATDQYYTSLKLSKPLLGVHIRLERLIISNKAKPGRMAKCVEQFLHEAKELVFKHHLNHSNAIAFRDYGPSGSRTCHRKKCHQVAKELKIDETLKSLGIHTLEYQPKDVALRPFVPLVEQDMLSRADYLLTLGFGSFQASIVKRFLKKVGKRKDSLIAICNSD